MDRPAGAARCARRSRATARAAAARPRAGRRGRPAAARGRAAARAARARRHGRPRSRDAGESAARTPDARLAGDLGERARRAADVGERAGCGRARRAGALPHHQPAESEQRAERDAPTAGAAASRAPTAASEPTTPGRARARTVGRQRARPQRQRQRRAQAGRPLTAPPGPRRLGDRAGPMPGIASRPSTDVNGAVLLAVVDDLLRRHRADAGQRVELLRGRGAERDRRRRRHPRRRRRRSAGSPRCGDENLLAVGDRSREVDPVARLAASARRRARPRRRRARLRARRTSPGRRTAPATSTTSAGAAARAAPAPQGGSARPAAPRGRPSSCRVPPGDDERDEREQPNRQQPPRGDLERKRRHGDRPDSCHGWETRRDKSATSEADARSMLRTSSLYRCGGTPVGLLRGAGCGRRGASSRGRVDVPQIGEVQGTTSRLVRVDDLPRTCEQSGSIFRPALDSRVTPEPSAATE